MMRDETREHMLKHIFAICDEAGLNRRERLGIAELTLGVTYGTIKSYKQLTDEQVATVRTAFIGWRNVQLYRFVNGKMEIEAIEMRQIMSEMAEREKRRRLQAIEGADSKL